MIKVRPTVQSFYVPWHTKRLITLNELVLELQASRSGFSIPKSLQKKIEILVISKVLKFIPSLGSLQVLVPELPLYWVSVLKYLHQNRVIDSPIVGIGNSDHRLPRSHNFKLSSPSEEGSRPVRSYGRHETLDVALAKTVGEMLERFHFCDASPAGNLLVPSAWDNRSDVLAPQNLSWRQPFPDTNPPPIHFTKGCEHTETGQEKSILIPTQSVFMRFPYKTYNEPLLYETTSSGCAGSFTRDGALLSGLYELIERDGFLVHWFHRISPPRIDPTSIPSEQIKRYLPALRHYGIECHFLDVRTDINTPNVTCLLIDRKQNNTLAMGAAAGHNLLEIFDKALFEALIVYTQSLHLPETRLPSNYQPFSDLNLGRHERLALWHGSLVDEQAAFITSGPIRSFSDTYNDSHKVSSEIEPDRLVFKRLVKYLAERGHRVLSYTNDKPLIKKLNYHVVRVMVPTLIPLHLREAHAPIHHPRLVSSPLTTTNQTVLNPYPHPFP